MDAAARMGNAWLPAAVLGRIGTRRPASRPRAEEAAPDRAAAERDFLNDMLMRSPDAFAGEQDVVVMMMMCPGRF